MEAAKLKLPNASIAYVQESKIVGYLLSTTHEVGKAKAKFFLAVGFSRSHPKLLEEALLYLARTQVVSETIETIHGTKYVITGAISTPSGKTITILTVWIVDNGEEAPRFVTARPYKDK